MIEPPDPTKLPLRERKFRAWAMDHNVEEFTEQWKGGRMIFLAGWAARGNPWVNLLGAVFVLAFLAYWITLLTHH